MDETWFLSSGMLDPGEKKGKKRNIHFSSNNIQAKQIHCSLTWLGSSGPVHPGGGDQYETEPTRPNSTSQIDVICIHECCLHERASLHKANSKNAGDEEENKQKAKLHLFCIEQWSPNHHHHLLWILVHDNKNNNSRPNNIICIDPKGSKKHKKNLSYFCPLLKRNLLVFTFFPRSLSNQRLDVGRIVSLVHQVLGYSVLYGLVLPREEGTKSRELYDTTGTICVHHCGEYRMDKQHWHCFNIRNACPKWTIGKKEWKLTGFEHEKKVSRQQALWTCTNC